MRTYVAESYDPWLVGSILLAIKLFLVLLALAATLLYIVCYRIKDKVIIEERPTVTVLVYLLITTCNEKLQCATRLVNRDEITSCGGANPVSGSTGLNPASECATVRPAAGYIIQDGSNFIMCSQRMQPLWGTKRLVKMVQF